MRVQVLRENLLHGLALVNRAVPSRATDVIREHVLLATEDQGLRLAASDGELTITCVVGVHTLEEQGATAVRARVFTDLIQTLDQNLITLTYQPESALLQVTAGANETQLKCLEADLFPMPPLPDMDDALTLPPDVFREAVDQVVFAASKEDARPVLTGVSLRTTEERLALAATDGFRLAIRWITLERPFPPGWDFILPARTMKELDRIVAKTEAPLALKPLEKTQMAFRSDTVDVLSTLIEGAYPNYEALIPTSFNTRVVVNRDLFLRACKQAKVFTQERFNEAVRLHIEPGEEGPGTLRVSAQMEDLGGTNIPLAAVVEGEPITVGFNVRFLLEALEAIPTPEVALELIAPASPAVVRPVGRDDYLHIIMPMQI